MLLKLLLKVTEVTTEHQKWPKISKTNIKSSIFAEKQKQPRLYPLDTEKYGLQRGQTSKFLMFNQACCECAGCRRRHCLMQLHQKEKSTPSATSQYLLSQSCNLDALDNL